MMMRILKAVSAVIAKHWPDDALSYRAGFADGYTDAVEQNTDAVEQKFSDATTEAYRQGKAAGIAECNAVIEGRRKRVGKCEFCGEVFCGDVGKCEFCGEVCGENP